MKHFQKICDGIDVAPLLAQIEAKPQLWDQINYRRTGKDTPHADMLDQWIRYDDIHERLRTNTLEDMRKPFIPMWYPSWYILTELHPIVFNLMATVNGEMLGGIFLTKIRPGGKILPHVDKGWNPEYMAQFYVSLKSESGANFMCEVDGEQELINPKPGEVWRFKNTKLHWVNNDSTSDRITLIVGIRTEIFG